MNLQVTYEAFIKAAAELHGVSEEAVKLWLQTQLNHSECKLHAYDSRGLGMN